MTQKVALSFSELIVKVSISTARARVHADNAKVVGPDSLVGIVERARADEILQEIAPDAYDLAVLIEAMDGVPA